MLHHFYSYVRYFSLEKLHFLAFAVSWPPNHYNGYLQRLLSYQFHWEYLFYSKYCFGFYIKEIICPTLKSHQGLICQLMTIFSSEYSSRMIKICDFWMRLLSKSHAAFSYLYYYRRTYVKLVYCSHLLLFLYCFIYHNLRDAE